MSSPPPTSPPPMVWPPSNPSGTVIPFPLPWGQTGCCPPGGMDALMKCYCDIQAATAFISKVVTDLAANDPAFQQALVDGIAASGSNLPLIGVTNGAQAQPGQVGEFIGMNSPTFNYAVGSTVQSVTMPATLPPGDWDTWAQAGTSTSINLFAIGLNPLPPGFASDLGAWISDISIPSSVVSTFLIPAAARALTSAPSLINFNVQVDSSVAGTGNIAFFARRRR